MGVTALETTAFVNRWAAMGNAMRPVTNPAATMTQATEPSVAKPVTSSKAMRSVTSPATYKAASLMGKTAHQFSKTKPVVMTTVTMTSTTESALRFGSGLLLDALYCYVSSCLSYLCF
jgi:hypothetical protein